MPRQYLGTTARNSSFGVLDIGSCQFFPHSGDSFCRTWAWDRLKRGETGSGKSLNLFVSLLSTLSFSRLRFLHRDRDAVGSSRTSNKPLCDVSEHPSAPLCRFSNLPLK
jgi:hypothetical protein